MAKLVLILIPLLLTGCMSKEMAIVLNDSGEAVANTTRLLEEQGVDYRVDAQFPTELSCTWSPFGFHCGIEQGFIHAMVQRGRGLGPRPIDISADVSDSTIIDNVSDTDSAIESIGSMPGPLVHEKFVCVKDQEHLFCNIVAWTDGPTVLATAQSISAGYAGAFVEAMPSAFTSKSPCGPDPDTLFFVKNAALGHVKIGSTPVILGAFQFKDIGSNGTDIDALPKIKQTMFSDINVRVWNNGRPGFYSPIKIENSEWETE